MPAAVWTVDTQAAMVGGDYDKRTVDTQAAMHTGREQHKALLQQGAYCCSRVHHVCQAARRKYQAQEKEFLKR